MHIRDASLFCLVRLLAFSSFEVKRSTRLPLKFETFRQSRRTAFWVSQNWVDNFETLVWWSPFATDFHGMFASAYDLLYQNIQRRTSPNVLMINRQFRGFPSETGCDVWFTADWQTSWAYFRRTAFAAIVLPFRTKLCCLQQISPERVKFESNRLPLPRNNWILVSIVSIR